MEDKVTRLDMAKEKIKNLATSSNSLVLLKSSPVVALQNVNSRTLSRYLDRLEATDDTSDVAAAISLAGDLLNKNKGRVVVASDFISSKGVSVDVAKNILESRGIPVDFVDTKTSLKNNVGISDMIIRGEEISLYVKNFNNVSKDISLKINKNTNNIHLNPLSVEPFVFNLVDNMTNAEIVEKDDFMMDNKVVITRPYSDKIKVLLISNNPSKFLKAVLNSIDGVVLTLSEPPIIPDGKFDVYIFDNVDRNKIVVDNFGSIMREIRDNGGSAVVVAQQDSDEINYEGLIPMKINSLISGGSISVEQTNKFTKDVEVVMHNRAAKNIVYLNKTRNLEKVALDLSSRTQKPNIINENVETLCKAMSEYLHEDYNLLKCIKGGVVYHHGSMPDIIRLYAEHIFTEMKEFQFIVTSSTLLEGVNIPAEKIFVLDSRTGRAAPVRRGRRAPTGSDRPGCCRPGSRSG